MKSSQFAVAEIDMNEIVKLVENQARDECRDDTCPVFGMLSACSEQAVNELWDSTVKTFVPLLALRQVRSCIRNGQCPDVWSASSMRFMR